MEYCGLRPITNEEFAQLSAFVRREAGIHLSEVKKALVVGRLARRVKELGLASFGEYYRFVEEGSDPEEKTRLLDRISTNETHFFREPKHFEFLERTVFPEWEAKAAAGTRQKRARIWSAACSTGEEPYSLAMSALDAFPARSGWDVKILATDLSTRVLSRARAAVWPMEKAREIPPRQLKEYMLKGVGTQEGRMRAGPEIRAMVAVEGLNLMGDMSAAHGTFDLIFCRNVLIYFDAETKTRVIERLLDKLAPGGYLFLGHSETLNGLTTRAKSVIPTVYVPVTEA